MKFSDVGVFVEDMKGLDGFGEDYDVLKFTHLGSGASSSVFTINQFPDYVIKMVDWIKDPFISLMLNMDQETRESCGLPVMYDVWGNEDRVCFLLKRYYDANFTEQEKDDLMSLPYFFREGMSDRIKGLEKYCDKISELYGEKIGEDDEGEWLWDLHSSNVMMDTDGELVLTDPLCC